MKRLLTSAAAAAVLVAGTGSGAQAQDASASLFDLALYGGIAYNYNWLDLEEANFAPADAGDNLNPGFAPLLGASATFWTNPTFGIRTNVFYMDIDLPDGSAPESVNGWMYDLDLMIRPWIARGDISNIMQSMYFFLGGGGFTANPPGEGPGCVSPYWQDGACLALESDKSSVGQGTFGLGFDMMDLASNIGLFAELGAHVYDSPFHTGVGWTGNNLGEGMDTYGITPRLVAGLKFGFGELFPPVVPVAPPITPPAPVTPPPAPPTTRTITVCVVDNGALREVSATYTPSTGDTTVNNRDFSDVYPTTVPTYASGATWYINNDSITVNGEEYVRFGVARVITPPSQLTRVGEFQGTPIFGQTGEAAPQQVLYVPLRPGCEFQPYQLREEIRVRG
jgi:hypothetical protein